jgi:hypothetical protein
MGYIGVVQPGGVKAIRCDVSEYLSVGETLYRYYLNQKKVNALISMGHAFLLGSDLRSSTFYWRDYKMPLDYEVFENIGEYETHIENSGPMYSYLFDGGVWYVYHQDESKFTPIADLYREF